jgi:hypothetical protein
VEVGILALAVLAKADQGGKMADLSMAAYTVAADHLAAAMARFVSSIPYLA